MTDRANKPPALKHGGFSATTILPGESASEFEELHRGVIADLSPVGVLEEEVALTMAHTVWRRKNLPIFSKAQRAQQRVSEIRSELLRGLNSAFEKSDDPQQFEEDFNKKWRAAENQAREELGDAYELVEMGDDATLEGLAKQLDICERLDRMFAGCLKHLLMLRGVKSLSVAPPPAPRERLSGPASP